MVDIDSMSKKQLEAFARKELDIELDRRHNKKDLLKRVKSELKPAPSERKESAPSERKESAPIIKEDSTSAVKDIAEALNFDPYIGVIAEARAQVGDDLVKLKEHIKYLNDTSQENYQLILTEIDKYKD